MAAMASFSSNDLEHNIWNPLLDALSDYRIGPVPFSLLTSTEKQRAGASPATPLWMSSCTPLHLTDLDIRRGEFFALVATATRLLSS